MNAPDSAGEVVPEPAPIEQGPKFNVRLNIVAGVSHPRLWTGPGQPWSDAEKGPGERAKRAAGPFLVPRGNNSINVTPVDGRELSRGQSFEIEIAAAVAKFGVERIGLWTSTPGDYDILGEFQKVTDFAEASRRWNSLRTNAIAGRAQWRQWVLVMQRHKDGGVHYHVLVVHREDIRGRLDFAALKRRDYSSANAALKAEWGYWRQVAKNYRFGRVEFLPLYDADGAGKYLARYLRRDFGNRRESDANAQLYRFSRSWHRAVQGPACWADKRAQRAMRRAAELGFIFWGSQERMEADLGPRWKWRLRQSLWCSDQRYQHVLWFADEAHEQYNGPLFLLEEAHRHLDAHERAAAVALEKLGPMFAPRRRGALPRWHTPDQVRRGLAT